MTLRSGLGRVLAALPLALATWGSLGLLGGFAGGKTGGSLVMGLGAGLAVWILWPLMGRRPGRTGIAADALLALGALILGGAIGGTLIQPGAFTIIGAISALMLPLAHPAAAACHAIALIAILFLARRKAQTPPTVAVPPAGMG
jgi:hypothetical protein